MDNSSQRKLLWVSPACEIPQLAGEITAALVGNGPTLGFGQITSEFAPANCAVVIGTSGSSGPAKEVALSATALLTSARAANTYIGARAGDTWSLLLPLTHIAAVNVVIRAIELGTLPIDLRNVTTDYPRVNFTAIVPTQLFRALNGDARLLKHLRDSEKVLVGGAALSQGMRNQAEAAGIKVIATYGMTETCGGCIYDGTPLAGVEVEIFNGKINLRGPSLAMTYLNFPWVLRDGWFETNDLGEMHEDKVVITGRSDDVIISGSENLSLAAVENSLAIKFPNLQCAAFSLADPQWGQALHLAIVGDFEDSQISSHLESDFGVFAKPKGIYHVASLPLLGIGKVDKKTLAREFNHE